MHITPPPASPLVHAQLQDMVKNLVSLVKQEAPELDVNAISLHWNANVQTPYLFIHTQNICEQCEIDKSIKHAATVLLRRRDLAPASLKLAFHNANA